MELGRKTGSQRISGRIGRQSSLCSILIFLSAFLSFSCTQLEKPEPEPFFAETIPPKVQEFRWSNGRLPKSFDPALAAAPPETDVVRAMYEGLTETDPVTLVEVAGVAESWSSSEDLRVWTFKIRKSARWSNGKHVTANDFVRAWKRLIKLGDKTAHRVLLSNIAGVPKPAPDVQPSTTDAADPLLGSNSNQSSVAPLQQMGRTPTASNSIPVTPAGGANTNTASPAPTASADDLSTLGVVADDDLTLRVTLVVPDKEFPRLVANPIFRPIFNNGEEFVGKELNTGVVTNGPFRVAKADQSGIVLERSANYWNRDSVRLERVHLVAMDSPEKALAAYRAGDLDAITNTDFSPLVLKLLTPYEDFRKTTHSALNFYEVNAARPPFSDRRVRQALSNAIERERLTEVETDGMARPALGFLPYSSTAKAGLTQDKEKARELLDEAGFPEGAGFPVIKLLVNRNETQQRIARSVARMWKQNLNIETEIQVKEAVELERQRAAGDFDIVRRGVVFPTSDQAVSFQTMFPAQARQSIETDTPTLPSPSPSQVPVPGNSGSGNGEPNPQGGSTAPVILTEEDALYELRAIPLYFPTSFSLIKPYVAGFETNSLDAVTLANVAINSEWRPQAAVRTAE